MRDALYERTLVIEQIATHLGVNPDAIYKWIEWQENARTQAGASLEVDEWVNRGSAAENVAGNAANLGGRESLGS